MEIIWEVIVSIFALSAAVVFLAFLYDRHIEHKREREQKFRLFFQPEDFHHHSQARDDDARKKAATGT